MRNSLIGVGAAAAILIVLFVLSRVVPAPQTATPTAAPTVLSPAEIAQSAEKVTPGFLGSTMIGEYNVACAKTGPSEAPKPQGGAIPFTLNASGGSAAAPSTTTTPEAAPAAPQPPASGIKLGRCRAAVLVHANDKARSVVLIAVFRLVENQDEVAMILHTGPVLKPGTKVIVALADKQVIGLPVTSCEKTQCMALGILKSKVYPLLVSRPKLVVVVPVQKTGQRMIIPLSTSGLSQSVEAMRRAG